MGQAIRLITAANIQIKRNRTKKPALSLSKWVLRGPSAALRTSKQSPDSYRHVLASTPLSTSLINSAGKRTVVLPSALHAQVAQKINWLPCKLQQYDKK